MIYKQMFFISWLDLTIIFKILELTFIYIWEHRASRPVWVSSLQLRLDLINAFLVSSLLWSCQLIMPDLHISTLWRHRVILHEWILYLILLVHHKTFTLIHRLVFVVCYVSFLLKKQVTKLVSFNFRHKIVSKQIIHEVFIDNTSMLLTCLASLFSSCLFYLSNICFDVIMIQSIQNSPEEVMRWQSSFNDIW